MAVTILSPSKSFVQFNASALDHCIWGDSSTCLPVFDDDDVKFQFVAQAATSEEADSLCILGESGIQIGLVRDCDQLDFDVEFTEQPERYRISSLQVLYNWSHGLTGMSTEFSVGECFYIRVIVDAYPPAVGCSNCFQRIDDTCFTSSIEYGNDENFAGFNYCSSGGVDDDISGLCTPTYVTFLNKTTLSIPYTTSLKVLYGDLPTVQIWIYDGGGNLVNAGVSASFDAIPVNMITIDLGGLASGVVVIK